MRGRDTAVIAVDTHPWYAFYAPLTAMVWSARGWCPLVIFVGDEEVWDGDPRAQIVRDRCCDVPDSRIARVDAIDGFRSATWAQVVRLFAAEIESIDSSDYLLTSDADMWPLGDWVGGGRDDNKDLQIYYSNAHRTEPGARPHFPMCYLGARVSAWREIVGPSPEFTVVKAAGEARLDGPVHRIGGEEIPLDVWNLDETVFGEFMLNWPGYPSRCQLIERDMTKVGQKRLDRAGWVELDNLDGYADAHLPRPGSSAENWPRVRRLFDLATGEGEWADDYYEDLKKAMVGR